MTTKTTKTTKTTVFSVSAAEGRAIINAAKAEDRARDKLRGLMVALAERAVAEKTTRLIAGKALAKTLKLKALGDNKTIANAWQYAAQKAGLPTKASDYDTPRLDGVKDKQPLSAAKLKPRGGAPTAGAKGAASAATNVAPPAYKQLGALLRSVKLAVITEALESVDTDRLEAIRDHIEDMLLDRE